MMPIGFVGLGNMGQPMVARIAAAGYAVVAFDNRAEARDALAGEANVSAVSNVADMLAVTRTVILMLPDSKVVEQVVWGGPIGDTEAPVVGSLAAGMPDGGTIIDMSSSFPLATQELGRALEPLAITLIDAPVSGGVAKAVTGELAIMAGGPEVKIAELQHMMSSMGTVHHAGDLGAGHALKALNNYVSAAGLLATSEALVIGSQFGLEPERMIDILNVSTGRNNTTENKAKRFMVSQAYNSGFAFALMQKDVGMARDVAAGLGLDAECLRSVSGQLDAMADRLEAGADHTEVHRDMTRRNSR